MSSSNIPIPEPSQKFSNLQLELLRLYSFNISDEELIKIKEFIGKMFLHKLSDEVNKAIEEKSIQPQQLQEWLDEKS